MTASKQRRLFAAEPLVLEPKPWDVAAALDLWVARVVVNRPLETPFDYLVPDPLRELLRPGMRVRVPFGQGQQRLIGHCVAVGPLRELIGPERFHNGRPPKLKSIEEVLDREPLLSPRMLELTRWIADRYLCGWGQVLECVVPGGVKKLAGTREILYLAPAAGIRESLAKRKLPAKQRVVLEVLCAADRPLRIDELTKSADCSVAVIGALRTKQLVETIRQRTDTFDGDETIVPRQPDLTLNAQQSSVLDSILTELRAARHRTILLRGVTGSGKTEVYIQAIREVVRMGRQAIVLVPEISLTPQTIRRFRSRFDRVAVLHSQLSDSERHWHWQQIASGQIQVVVGARSAVFAPTPNLGLIVIDEEHETSFKQEETPRYHAREVARERARLEGIPLLLGTATPTLESWWRATGETENRKQKVEGQLENLPPTADGSLPAASDLLLTLSDRVAQLPLPPVTIVDTRNDPFIGRGEALGRALGTQIRQTLQDGGQVILFLNLRGFAPIVWCKACGESVRCPHCDITLTFHKDRNRVLCHSCDYEAPPLTKCPRCAHPGVYYFGIGTQRLEQEVQSKFGKSSCIRMDSDTMKKAGSHDDALERFRLGKAKILLGTQMIAKGLDFPNVTLVGVVNADTLLHTPDLRSAERTFQLIAQVAGRTGRSKRGGRVLVQSACPTEPSIALAAKHDFLAFAAHELKLRREANAPPFCSLARVILRGAVEDRVKAEATAMGTLLRKTAEQLNLPVRLLGPAPCPITKVRDYWRYHLQLSAESFDSIRTVWRTAIPNIPRVAEVEFQIDVDPINMR
jgi:primosomal protein N' (replication factor Y)